MSDRATPARYHGAAIALHWLIALALVFQISLGWTLHGPESAALFNRYQLHKSIGLTILLLSLARLAIRLFVPRPAPSEKGPTRYLAEAVHWLFYLVMIGGPISGWIIVSTAKVKVQTLFWGVIPWPHLPVPKMLNGPAGGAHELLALLAFGLFLLHVAGALRHQWLLGKPELQRMIPFARGKAVGAAIGALALIFAALWAGKLVYVNAPRADAAPKPVVEAPADEPAAATNTVASPPEPAENATEAAPATLPLSDWQVVKGGRLGFAVQWNDSRIHGSFSAWQAKIRFSPDVLDQSTIRVTVDLASVASGDGMRDDSLKGSDFFDTATHPQAVFASTAIRHLGGDRYQARGTLTMRGVAQPATLAFTLKIQDKQARVQGSTRIDRTAFGVGQGEWASTAALAGSVAIDFNFRATASN